MDVSALGGVHTVKLYDCKGIIDFSALGQVHDLDLLYCKNVVDVSKYCDSVVDFTTLVNIPQLI